MSTQTKKSQELSDLQILNARADLAARIASSKTLSSTEIEQYVLKYGDEVWERYSPQLAKFLKKVRGASDEPTTTLEDDLKALGLKKKSG